MQNVQKILLSIHASMEIWIRILHFCGDNGNVSMQGRKRLHKLAQIPRFDPEEREGACKQ